MQGEGERRRYTRADVIPRSRSTRVLFAAVALLAFVLGVAVLFRAGPGQAGPTPAGAAPVEAVAPAAPGRRRVILIGLGGADWDLLDTYIAAGAMPNLAALAHDGTAGVLTTIQPPLSPLVWTTMMTGRGPLEHGILD